MNSEDKVTFPKNVLIFLYTYYCSFQLFMQMRDEEIPWGW